MFGLDFLFAAALWGLPLAGLPVLLHMLFRRKSPVVRFSTLRFIKSSIQQTAARKRVQRWVLLACRVLLMALLIWAIAQPVRILASGWFDSGQSLVAAIVVDTSYSMQLKQQEVTLLDKASDIVQELLRQPLKDGRVAIFRSQPPPPDQPEQLRTATKALSEWSALKPQPSRRPLADRYAAATAFLNRQQATGKWLVIISDMQSREFPAALPPPEDTRVVLFDLQPEKANTHGVTAVSMEPRQPIPGVGSQVVTEITGHAGDAPFVNLTINRLDGGNLKAVNNLQATFASTGRSRIRVPLKDGLPAEPWLLVTAALQRTDDLAWANSRSQLVQLPPRQLVSFFDTPSQPAASNFIRLALDPWESKVTSWPLEVKRTTQLSGAEHVAFIPLTEWPDPARTTQLTDFARRGGTLVLFLQPGLEVSWAQLNPARQSALAALLPSPISASPTGESSSGSGVYHPAAPGKPDRVLEGLTDPSFRLNQLAIRRFVPLAPPTDPSVSTVLYLLSAAGQSQSASSTGLLYRRSLGSGAVFTFATLPDARYISPPTHPIFLPLLVSIALNGSQQDEAQNVELGQTLQLTGQRYANIDALEIQGPAGLRYQVPAQSGPDGRKFTFEQTTEPGIYYWRKPGDGAPVAVANVQLPAEECDLIYKKADSVVTPGPTCLVVRSFAELQSSMARITEPQPQWTWPIAIVLILMCLEAILGSMSHLWKPVPLRQLLPGLAGR